MDYLRKIMPFSVFGLVLLVLALSEFNSNSGFGIRLLSVYLGSLGLLCFIASLLLHKVPKLLWIIPYTVLNIAAYLVFSVVFALVVGKSLVLAGWVLLLNGILGILLREIYMKAKNLLRGSHNEVSPSNERRRRT